MPPTNPELYTTIPSQPREKKHGQLSEKQLKEYFEEGFVIVRDFFSPDELQPVRDAVADLVDKLANKLYDAGKIKKKHLEAGLFQRMTLIEKQFPGSNVLMHKMDCLPQAFRDLWSHERLLNVVEQMIGPEIAGHPVWNLRVKTPKNEQATVPWHQDNAYLAPEALDVLQPTAWIPLLDADEFNGCMQVIRKGHLKGETARHTCCAGGTWYVEVSQEDMEKTLDVNLKEDVVTCPVPYGGVLFINNCIPHRSLENYSNKIRWSLDLRWQKPDLPNGFYGLKNNILMRTQKDPKHMIDFDSFDNVKRHKLAHEVTKDKSEKDVDVDDEFDTTIRGPWMQRWEIVHHNKHTKALNDEERESSWHKA